MIKSAKPSSDPVQEKLRQNKKVWNKQVSEFADNLFRLKDMMNGKPSKFHPEKSSIKDPIPGDPVTIIGTLAGDFQEIAQKGNALVQEQLSYAKGRKKKQPKQVLAPMPMAPAPPANDTSPTDLSKQLAAEVEVFEMIALGSNRFTRFFAQILNPTIGSGPIIRTRKYRMSLLKAAVEIYKDLVRLESIIVESTPESIFTANRFLTKIIGNWEFFKTGISTYNESDNKVTPSESGGEISSEEDGRATIIKSVAPIKPAADLPKENKPIVVEKPLTQVIAPPSVLTGPDAIVEDYKRYSANFTGINMKELTKWIGKYRIEKGTDKDQAGNQLQSEYNNVLAQLNALNGTTGQSFKEIFEAKKAKASIVLEQLESVGQLVIQRWLSKLKHQISPLDKTSAHRLDIYNAADDARKIVDSMMNSLEKEMNVDHLMKLAGEVDLKLKRMEHLMSGLEGTLRGSNFDKSFMNLLDSGKITNFSPDLNPNQRQHLQRMIDRRRVRDLTDMYQGRR